MTTPVTYAVEISRQGRWWVLCIPAIAGVTQARFAGEAEGTARDYIASWLGVAPQSFTVELRWPL